MLCSMYVRAVSCFCVGALLFIVEIARSAASSSVRLGILFFSGSQGSNRLVGFFMVGYSLGLAIGNANKLSQLERPSNRILFTPAILSLGQAQRVGRLDRLSIGVDVPAKLSVLYTYLRGT